MNKNWKISFGIFSLALLGLLFSYFRQNEDSQMIPPPPEDKKAATEGSATAPEPLHPMSIASLRAGKYEGSDFALKEKLPNGSNYQQFIVSYQSEGLKIFGLLTVPNAPRPEKGFPSIVFVHGYIQPDKYSTTGNYPTYQARLARSGFITFKPDLRGHGDSEGEATGAHFSEKYVVDTLNAISSLKKHKDVDPQKIGYWGHSNGGEIGLRVAVVSSDIKSYVFWAGVVGSYVDMFETYNEKIPFLRNLEENSLIKDYGLPSQNPDFWNKLDPYSFLSDVSAPIHLHHGTGDPSVPIELSRQLEQALKQAGKEAELFEYPGDNHNISNSLDTAWKRSIEFYTASLQ